MAIDMWSSESSTLGISPRISFSHDLCQTDVIPIHRPDALLLDSSSDFDFCVSESFEQESSCADELFSDGKLLPLQIKSQTSVASHSPKPPTPPNKSAENNSKKESLKEIMEKSSETEEKSLSKSFWRFTRSSSCGNGYKRSLICSLPLLSRSNSTGSAPNTKRKPSSSSSTIAKSSSLSSSSSSSSSSSCSSYSYSYLHKPPLRKNHRSYNNGIRISPVLNVPPPYIPKGTINLFGLRSFFCNGKDKSKKK